MDNHVTPVKRKPPPDASPLAMASVMEPAAAYSAMRAHFPPGEHERTSFRLTAEAAGARDWITGHLQVSQRALFDRIPLYLDQAVRAYDPDQLRDVLGGLPLQGERKTYLLSRETLERINAHAEQSGVSRDALVCFALVGLRYLVEQGADLARSRRVRFAEEVAGLAAEVERLRSAALDELGPEDALHRRLAAVAADVDVLARQLQKEKEGGRHLDSRT